MLGAVELSVRGRPVTLGTNKLRCLAAALALDVGRPVPLDILIGRLWGNEPPAKARAAVHSYISRLRSALRLAQHSYDDGGGNGNGNRNGGDTEGGTPPVVISRKAHAYALDTDPNRVDWPRYLLLGRRARSLADAGKDHEALDVLRRADDTWRGEPLAGLPGQWAQATRITMRDQWLATTLTRCEVELRLGHFAELVPELSALAEQRPTDERVAGHLITALYGCDRFAEALDVFRRTRRELLEYLGTEPGEQLRALQHRVLRRAPIGEILTRPARAVTASSSAPTAAPTAPTAAGLGPARNNYLPVRHRLAGREAELRHLLSAATSGSPEGAGGCIRAVSGMAGSGKTSLVVTAAHLLRDRFPDGQYYVDLRANGGAQQPLETEAVATLLLRQFGVPAASIPTDPDELASHCRSLLAERRAVVVLDDARGPGQVRPLLPGNPASCILITSRHRLAELPCSPLYLEPMSREDAVELFTMLVGKERADDPAGVEALIERCGRLPLAVDLAASRFKAHPTWSLDYFVRRLSRRTGRLGELHHGLESVALAFEVSYRSLPRTQQEAFRRLGLHPGPDFGPDTAAALVGRPLRETDRILESLHDLHMLQENSPERYVLHDLLREFAVDLVTAEERRQAVRRLVGFALRAADRADRTLHPRRFRRTVPELPQLAPVAGLVDDLVNELADGLDRPDDRAVKAWLRVELPGLVSVEALARAAGLGEEAAWLAHVLAELLDSEGLWREADEMHRAAAHHWHSRGEDLAESHALLALASIRIHTARYPLAERAAERALTIARTAGDTGCAAEALEKLARIRWSQSDLSAALAMQREVVEIHRKSGDEWNRARCLNNLGAVLVHLGDTREALESFTEALPLAESLNDSRLRLQVLGNLAGMHLNARNPDAARDAFEQILAIGEGILSSDNLAVIRMNLAGSLPLPAESARATDLLRSALHTFHQTGNRRDEAEALNGLGTVHLGTGRYDAALDQYAQALKLARSIGAQREAAAALRGLGRAEQALDRTSDALDHLQQAVTLSRRIEATEEEAHACETLAELQWQAGQVDAGRTTLRRAVELTESARLPESKAMRNLRNKFDQKAK
ncbi:tetratricopeptide repeat protein [Kitasatospora sp. NPDC058444]|uniref:AfsR/SARP family transcriptional regulator n=1 Tax=Kitasatospora sp. NPDC058444 TaxID=3346504 RepID=UPI003655FA1D